MRPQGDTEEDRFGASEPKREMGRGLQTSEHANLPFQHTSPRSIWPIINHPGEGY